jgi:hypothetical protein
MDYELPHRGCHKMPIPVSTFAVISASAPRPRAQQKTPPEDRRGLLEANSDSEQVGYGRTRHLCSGWKPARQLGPCGLNAVQASERISSPWITAVVSAADPANAKEIGLRGFAKPRTLIWRTCRPSLPGTVYPPSASSFPHASRVKHGLHQASLHILYRCNSDIPRTR